MEMIYSAITIFGIVAIFGLYLLSLILRNKGTPKAVTLIHGLFAAIGLVLLIIYSLSNKTGPVVSIFILLIAFPIGIMLNYKDLTGKKVPKWLAILHGLLAVIGFAFLLIFTFCPS